MKRYTIFCLNITVTLFILGCSAPTAPGYYEETNLLFVSNWNGNNELYLTHLGTDSTRRLTHTIGGTERHLLRAHGGEEIAYLTEPDNFHTYLVLSNLDRADYVARASQPLFFSPDGNFIFFNAYDGLYRLKRYDTVTKKVSTLLSYRHFVWEMDISADNSQLLYTGHRMDAQEEQRGVFLYDFASAAHTRAWLLENHSALFVPDGESLLFYNRQEMYLLNLDDSSKTVLVEELSDFREPRFAPDGETLFFFSGEALYSYNILSNTKTLIESETDFYSDFDISEDGRLLAFEKERLIWICRSDGSGKRAVTPFGGANPIILSNDKINFYDVP